MTKYILFFSTTAMLMMGCAVCRYPDPELTLLQMREQQTCVFEACSVETTMKALVNILQDEGFIVKNTALEIGLLTAEKQVNNGPECTDSFFTRLKGCNESSAGSQSLVEVTVNVSEYGDHTKVRANFISKKLDNRGSILESKPVTSDRYYQNFFAKVSKGIFFQIENI